MFFASLNKYRTTKDLLNTGIQQTIQMLVLSIIQIVTLKEIDPFLVPLRA